jgi:DNA repair protein RadD
MAELRSYQKNAIDKLRETLQGGKRKPVMVLSTGGGKSITFGQIIANAVEKGKIVLWIVHRRNLVTQMRDVLIKEFGITPGVIMAGFESDIENPVQLVSIQTYSRRILLGEKWNIPADIVLIDEAHRSVAKQYQNVIENYKDKIIIGCTATPIRADGRGLGEIYDSIVEIADVKMLTEQGYLAPVKYYVPVDIDLVGMRLAGGDYITKDLEGRMINTKLIGDVVQNWLKLAEGKKTIVYAVSVKHSIALRDEFIKYGVKAYHLDAKSPDEERDEVFNKMQSGEIDVICNVALYQEGLDVPNVEVIVMARPTKSLGLWRQCAGRGLRPSPGKDHCKILDHGNVIEDNGLLDWEIEWSLDGKQKAWKIKSGTKEKQACKCRVCHEIFEGKKECPVCGTPLKAFGKKIMTVEAELAEIEGKEKFDMVYKRRWWGMFLYYANTKGYKYGWAWHKYKEKFKVEPSNQFKNYTEPIEPDAEFLNHIKYLNIKWAKSKNKQKAQEYLDRGGELVEQYNLRLQ